MRWTIVLALAAVPLMGLVVPGENDNQGSSAGDAGLEVEAGAGAHSFAEGGTAAKKEWHFFEEGSHIALFFQLDSPIAEDCTFRWFTYNAGDELDLSNMRLDLDTGHVATATSGGLAYVHTPVVTYAPEGGDWELSWTLEAIDHLRIALIGFNLSPPEPGRPSASLEYACTSAAQYQIARADEVHAMTQRNPDSTLAVSGGLGAAEVGSAIEATTRFTAGEWGWIYLRSQAAGWNAIHMDLPSRSHQESLAEGEWLAIHDGPGDYFLESTSAEVGRQPLFGVGLGFDAGSPDQFGLPADVAPASYQVMPRPSV